MPHTDKKLRLADLVTDHDTGRLSHTRLWSNVAYAAATFLFVYSGVKGTLPSEVWFIYLGCVGGFTAYSKLLSLKYQSAKDKATGASE